MYSKRKVSANLEKKNHFQGHCDILKMKTLGEIRRFFGIELIKIEPIHCSMPNFENRKKRKISPP